MPKLAPHQPIPGSEAFSFCESIHAGALSRWHIRKLDAAGRKTGGGVTSPSFCGLVVRGWDLEVTITPHHLTHSCSTCVATFEKELALLARSPEVG